MRTLCLAATTAALTISLAACITSRTNATSAEPPPVFTTSDTVALFAPGVISTGDVFASSFTPDGRTVYFTKATSDRSSMHIMQSRWSNGAWTSPVRAPFSTGARQMDPHVAPDGKAIYFTAPRQRDATGNDPGGDWDTWAVRLEGGDLRPAARLSSLANSAKNETYPSITIDSTVFFGMRDRPIGIESGQTAPGVIAYSHKRIRTTPVVVPLTELGNPSNPYITPNGRVLIVSATAKDSRGRADLYVVTHSGDGFVSMRGGDGRWSAPRNLGMEVNSGDTEYCPSLSPDGKYLFFSRIRHDGDRVLGNDIYVVPVESVPVLRDALRRR